MIRSFTQSMDTAPRSVLLAMVLPRDERTAIMGLYNVGKTIAQASAPLITGVLVERGHFWAMFLLSGCIKALYDMGMFAAFGKYEKSVENAATPFAQLADSH